MKEKAEPAKEAEKSSNWEGGEGEEERRRRRRRKKKKEKRKKEEEGRGRGSWRRSSSSVMSQKPSQVKKTNQGSTMSDATENA